MNFVKRLKKRKTRPRRKNLNQHEKLFIKKHGVKLYDRLRGLFPELRREPSQWKYYTAMASYFGVSFFDALLEDNEGSINE